MKDYSRKFNITGANKRVIIDRRNVTPTVKYLIVKLIGIEEL